MDGGRKSFASKKLMTAYTILATMPGIPTIFYGDEAGLEGYGDPFNRMPYPWGKEEHMLIKHYQTLGAIRAENSVYKEGEFKLVHLDDRLLIFSRYEDEYAYVTVVNNSNTEISLEFSECVDSLLDNRQSNAFAISEFTACIYKMKANSSFELA